MKTGTAASTVVVTLKKATRHRNDCRERISSVIFQSLGTLWKSKYLENGDRRPMLGENTWLWAVSSRRCSYHLFQNRVRCEIAAYLLLQPYAGDRPSQPVIWRRFNRKEAIYVILASQRTVSPIRPRLLTSFPVAHGGHFAGLRYYI